MNVVMVACGDAGYRNGCSFDDDKYPRPLLILLHDFRVGRDGLLKRPEPAVLATSC